MCIRKLFKRKVIVTFSNYIVVPMFVATLLGSVQAAPVFPVKYSANSRYLVDQNGAPFPIMGRTAWFVVSLSVADYHTFVDNTASHGYSVIELHVINHDPRGNNPPFNGNGNAPFLKRLDGTTWNGVLSGSAPDFTTPNEAYWSFVDGFLSYCESKGILVFLFPAYVGYQGGDQGWMKEIVANGATKMQSYGAWIATRYKNQKNLVWMMGGDMGTSPYTFNSTQTSVENALLTGLKSVAGQQSIFFSAEWTRRSIATDQTTFGASMTLNGVYASSDDINTLGRRAYAYSPIEPAFLLEEPFDEEGPDGNNVNGNATQPVRRFQWWGWLSTIGGYVSGNGYVWPFRAPAWSNHLNSQGTHDMGRLNAFIGSIAWYNLVPSGLNGMRTLITAGGSSVSSSAYVSAAAAPNGTLMVAYIPPDHSGPITVDMGAMSGPTRARWFDPTSGAYTSIGTGLSNTGSRSFTPPGNNSAGAKDWVLLLDSATGNSPAPPTISDIPNQSTTVNTPTAAISFTINDTDTAVGSLTLGKVSSNPTLVPTNNIVFGGSGSNRTVTLSPANNQTGSATITVSVSDGTNSTSDTFVLTVNTVNTPPTISSIASQTISEDASSGPISFTIGDAETAAASLTLGKSSSNPTLIPTNNIVFGGSGANRTITVSPAANQNGSATITVTVSDGQYAQSTNFVMTVNAVNDPPTITGIGNQTINVNATTGPLNFTIGDVDTVVNSLTLSNNSSNPTLVTANNIVFGGSGTNRTVMVSPTTNQTGSSVITVTVSDGQGTASTSYTLTVNAVNTGLVAAYSFNEGTGTTVADASGNGNTGTISGATWTTSGKYGNSLSFSGSSARVTIKDSALLHLTTGMTLEAWVNPTTVNSAWRDVIYKGNDNYFLEATTTSGGGRPSVGTTIGGVNANLYGPSLLPLNTWSHLAATYDGATVRLYVNGVQVASRAQTGPLLTSTNSLQVGGDSIYGQTFQGKIDEVRVYNRALSTAELQSDMNAAVGSGSNTPPTISSIPAQTISEDTSTGPISSTIGDAETAAGSLMLSKGSSNPALVPTNNIVIGGSGTNRTVTVTPAAHQNGVATITVSVSDGQLSTNTTFVVMVAAVNDPPTISGISNQTINVNGTTGPLSFTVGDVETTVGSLTLSGNSSNTNLVTTNNIVFGGSGANRTITITPTAGQNGSATITVSVSDGQQSGSTNLVVTVSSPGVPSNPPLITSIAFDGQGQVQVTVSGETGFSYILQASSDWVNWTNVGAQTNVTGSIVFSEQPNMNSIRFYRAVSVAE